jgi:hypothetical protein
MTTLTHFFKESDSNLGVFYPKHYIIATFPTFEETKQAAQALRKAGFSDDEVLAIPGEEILKYFHEFQANSGLWAGVMTMLSRAFGTEQVFADDDVERARAGSGFLAVHSPTEAHTARIRELIGPFGPRAMHWYETGCIQTLI